MTVVIIYLDKLAHNQVIMNCPYSAPQMCTREDALAHILGAPHIDVTEGSDFGWLH